MAKKEAAKKTAKKKKAGKTPGKPKGFDDSGGKALAAEVADLKKQLEGRDRIFAALRTDIQEAGEARRAAEARLVQYEAMESKLTEALEENRELKEELNPLCASIVPESDLGREIAGFEKEAASGARGRFVVVNLETDRAGPDMFRMGDSNLQKKQGLVPARKLRDDLEAAIQRITNFGAIKTDGMSEQELEDYGRQKEQVDRLKGLLPSLHRDLHVLNDAIKTAETAFIVRSPVLAGGKNEEVMVPDNPAEIEKRRRWFYQAEGRRQQIDMEREIFRRHLPNVPLDSHGRPMPGPGDVQIMCRAYPAMKELIEQYQASERHNVARIGSLEEEVDKGRQALEQQGDEFKEKVAEAKAARDESEDLRKRIEEIEAEIEALRRQKDEEVEAARTANMEEQLNKIYLPQINAKEATIKSLEAQLESLRQDLARFSDPEKMRAWKEDGYQEAKREYEPKLAEKDSEIGRLRQEIEGRDSTISGLEERVGEKDTRIGILNESIAKLRESLARAQEANERLAVLDEAREALIRLRLGREIRDEIRQKVDADEHPLYTMRSKAKQDLDAAVAKALKDLCDAIEGGDHKDYMTRTIAQGKQEDAVNSALDTLKTLIRNDVEPEFITRNKGKEDVARAEEKAARRAVLDERAAIEAGKRKLYLSVRNLEPILQKARMRAETALMKRIQSGEHDDYITRMDARREADQQMKEQMERHIKGINNGVNPFFVPREWHTNAKKEAERIGNAFAEYRRTETKRIARAMRDRERRRTLAMIDRGEIGGYHTGKEMRDFALRCARKFSERVFSDFLDGVESGKITDYVTKAKHKAKLDELEETRFELEQALFEIDTLEYEAHHLRGSNTTLTTQLERERLEVARLEGVGESMAARLAEVEASIPELAAKAAADARNAVIRSAADGSHLCLVGRNVLDEAEAGRAALESELETTSLRALFSGIKTTDDFRAFMGSAGFVLMPDGKYRQDDIDRAAGMLANSYTEWEVRARYQLTPKFLDEVVNSRLVVKLNVGENSRYFVSAPEFVGALRDKGNELIDARKAGKPAHGAQGGEPGPASKSGEMDEGAAPQGGEEAPLDERAEGGEQHGAKPEEEKPQISIDYGAGIQPSPMESIARSSSSTRTVQREEVDKGMLLYIRAQKARDEKKYKESKELLQQASRAGFRDTALLASEMGINHLMLGNRKAAAAFFETALKHNPPDEVRQMAQHNLNMLYSGDKEKAAKFAALKGEEPGFRFYNAPEPKDGENGREIEDMMKEILPEGAVQENAGIRAA